MTPQKANRLAQLSKQLADTLMTVVICTDEIRAELRQEVDHEGCEILAPHDGKPVGYQPRPLLDQSTLSVCWKGRTVHLGNTRAFWLLERLSRRPNQYVTHLDLSRDIWDDEDTPTATIRSGVRHLRKLLVEGGMPKLAAAITGHSGRYILLLRP